ncbi:nitroreductase family deazaflavin-dependent oxidoreductase [Saccharothrix variisporea]|uniref:Deazaflavin-dependent oxidoreductase (Nitroreductase family) n=1 Tax=Saccharothrix variisporea TaxID=543527 RepID=A0A495XAI8_9PSEU|nr:nitroreductase family deazaflavin-dependent oxidoreductase [Saccharothrix variisporea]RKT68538.1 deazaflavin-dependent oxidoreductase (nitroreductase family) [Saccharothrix variisporea]
MAEALGEFNQRLVAEFRANGGRVGGRFEGANLLLLTTVGAKSGQERVSPLAYTRDGDRYVVAGSYAGSPKHPAWYFNILANPKVTLEVGEETFEATATVIEDRAERDRLYAGMVAYSPVFAEYEKKTERVIPVVVFERV